MNSERIFDVLIVGAGPVGLATAIALRQRGIDNILVIDRARSFRPAGQVVDILPNGLKALKYISEDAYQQIKTVGIEFTQARRQQSESEAKQADKKRFWYQKNLHGEIVRSIPLNFDFWQNRYGEGRVSIPWYRLQTDLRSLLPPELVKANHCCVDLTQDANSLTVNCTSDRDTANPFAHWENPATVKQANAVSTQPSCDRQFQAKLVVAADGINSTLRRLIYTDSDLSPWEKPQYSGFSAIGCMQIDYVSDEMMQQLEAEYFQGDMVVTLVNDSPELKSLGIDTPRLILLRRGANSLGYLFHTALNFDSLQNKSPEAIVNLAADILSQANFPTILIQVIKLSDLQALFHRPYYIHPANIPYSNIWSKDRLVLVGDAAHGMPPFAAQGVNQGLEDAAVVGTAIANLIRDRNIDNLDVIHSSFSKYEQLRRPLVEQVQEATMYNHNWSPEKWQNYGDAIYSRDISNICDELV